MRDSKLAKLLFKHPAYNITGHVRPDGDCVGSQLAIFNILRARGIAAHIIKNGEWSPNLSEFFEGCDPLDEENFDPTIPLICVDCSNFKRTGGRISTCYAKPYLNIDHHISNDNFAEHNVVDPRAPSTTQVIAHFLLAEGVDFDGKVAEMLYLGIMTDSGRFAYDSTSLETIKIVEVLMEKGVSISEMYRKVYERDSLARYRLLERFLHNMTVFGNGCCCTSFLEEKDFVETRTGPLDCEGFVNYTRQIDGVNGGAFLEFRNSYTKCSLRARDEKLRMDVFANQFGGGGHPAAAGFTIEARGPDFYEEFGRAFAEHVRKILPQLQP